MTTVASRGVFADHQKYPAEFYQVVVRRTDCVR